MIQTGLLISPYSATTTTTTNKVEISCVSTAGNSDIYIGASPIFTVTNGRRETVNLDIGYNSPYTISSIGAGSSYCTLQPYSSSPVLSFFIDGSFALSFLVFLYFLFFWL